MTKPAWQMDREMREASIPVDRRNEASHWTSDMEFPHGDELLRWNWNVAVPGSLAPDVFFQSMVQDWGNQGYDVSAAEELIPTGRALEAENNMADLRVVSARIMKALREAPRIPGHPYFNFEHPSAWEDVKAAMPAAPGYKPLSGWKDDFDQRILQGWIGQLAGASFGTAIEGYLGKNIEKVYGEVRGYVTQPETTNDDSVYELLLLDVFEKMGRGITSEALADEWVKKLPYGVSAEGTALRNLNLGIYPPESGEFLNPYCDWIGAQMRGMVCGMLAPGDPMEAARLAHIDAVISHARNGVYGEIYAAVLTSLAFVMDDPRKILEEGTRYIPARSEYASVLQYTFSMLKAESDPESAWAKLDKHFERYNWIHAYPNIAADMLALWYGQGDFTETMALLAKAGLDVDCNGGLVGNILGVIRDVPPAWADPIGDLMETYIKGKERLSIRELSAQTARLAKLKD
ncbi:MAG: ADP-ribosylglycohydrolase family protein [Anaerolineaceae bacterium]